MTLKLPSDFTRFLNCFGTIQSNMTLKLVGVLALPAARFGTIQSNMTLKPQIGFIQSSLGRRNL